MSEGFDILLPEIPQHPKIAAFLDKVQDGRFSIDMSLMDEIQGYISVAKEAKEKADQLKLPTRYHTPDDIHALGSFIARVQAYRDRVTEIKVELLPIQRSIHRVHEKAGDQLYHFEAVAKATPAPARDAHIRTILSPITDLMSKIDMVVNACDTVNQHLGNAWFTLKELKSIGIVYLQGRGDPE